MNIVLLLNEVSAGASASDRDVLMQRDAVSAALHRLGHQVTEVVCTLDLAAVKSRLEQQRPDVVFNLVESLGGTDHLMPAATLLLDALRIPYTGAPTRCILTTNDKMYAKQRLVQAGIPTARWFTTDALWQGQPPPTPVETPRRDCRVIVKAVWEHASFDLDDQAVVEMSTQGDDAQLVALLRSREEATGRAHFAEQFIDGREFNLSILAGIPGPQVLPPAEIDFAAFPANKPRIVGYRAKWDEDSFEYHHTPRCFDFASQDRVLLSELEQWAIRCWQAVGLRGYARVDFRVDADGQPWVLEVNANPCLALDAGFAAAIDRAGMTYDCAMDRLLHDARAHSQSATSQRAGDNH